jgi:hypothetical protein
LKAKARSDDGQAKLALPIAASLDKSIPKRQELKHESQQWLEST